ncbi:MAG: DUF5666 domain-containing protein [Leptothrix sp. (in: b-proteobacteria)]
MSDRPGPSQSNSPFIRHVTRPRVAGIALAALTALVIGCGGGGGGVGTNGTGSVNFGSVTGFGSVFLDSVRYDDSRAVVQIESASGFDAAEVKLGHRIGVESTGNADDTTGSAGVASRIELDPSLTGTIQSISGTGFTLLGQTVVTNDGSDTDHPVTVYDGFTTAGFAGLTTNSAVEVHALREVNGTSVTYYATRIEAKAALPFVRIAGEIQSMSGKQFALGLLTVDGSAATVLPSGTTLANGQSVVVYAAPPVGNGVLAATKIRVRARATSQAAGAYVSGLISSFQPAQQTFRLNGLEIHYANAELSLKGATLGANLYVRVKGGLDASGAFFNATKVQVRKSDEHDAEVHGTVSADVAASGATLRTLTIRDTLVQVPGGLSLSGCGSPLPGSYVEVHGDVNGQGIRASSVECKASGSVPATATREIDGDVSALNPDAKTFNLVNLTLGGTSGSTVAVRYTDTTFFRDPASSVLVNGKSVEIEGFQDGATFVATKVKLNN